MKKIYTIFISAAAMVLAFSCTQGEEGLNPPLLPEEETPLAPETPENPDSTGMETPGDSLHMREVTVMADMAGTKSLIDGNQVMWENGDELSLVFLHSTSSSYLSTFRTDGNEAPSSQANFTGRISLDVTPDAGYAHVGYAVYPRSAVAEDGSVAFSLPAEQRTREDGGFANGLNLASATVSLDDIVKEGRTSARFRNALSILRFTLDDNVTSLTLTGTAPLAGLAPLTLVLDESDSENGRLQVEADGEWSGSQTSVTLLPVEGQECFEAGVIYNLLVWPGAHESLTATIGFKDLGTMSKTAKVSMEFLPSKFYTLDFNLHSEDLVTEIEDGLDRLVTGLTEVENRLGLSEEDAKELASLMSQIQSVALMSEYLDNAVHAPYANLSSSKMKKDIVLDYIVRPASVAAELVSSFSEALSAQVYYKNGGLGFTTLPVKEATVNGDVMTVTVDASGISDSFYNGEAEAHLALQISDGNTELLSDFAKLVPQVQSALKCNWSENVPVVSGASVSIPFSYSLAPESPSPTFKCECSGGASAYIRDNGGTGYVIVDISGTSSVTGQKVKLVMTVSGTEYVHEFTFVEGGKLEITTDGPADHIGGEVVVTVARNDFSDGPFVLTSGGEWCTQNNMIFSCTANGNYSSRTAIAEYSVNHGGLTYNRKVEITQYGTSTPLKKSYYSDGAQLILNTAAAGYTPLNIVILGDGFQKKDLSHGGKFERTARSAMETFFAVEPFKTFRNRFNVYMVAYESADEGVDIKSSGVEKNTYFDAWGQGGGNTAANCNKDKVINVVKNVVGLSSDANYYRTIAIMLANTTENIGSCDYPSQSTISTGVVGDGYASFAVTTLAAYSTGTNGLIKHEAGGHGFGRLGDEYDVSWYTADLINQRHNVGYYRNVATSTSYWNAFTNAGYGSDKVTYDSYCSGIYRSTARSGIMWNNNGTFNAVSRHAIYERIIKQSEGYSAYSWSNFLIYDKRNL